jgi:integrase
MFERKKIIVWVQRFPGRNTLALQWHDPETGKRKTRSAETGDDKKADERRADLEYQLNKGLYEEPSSLNWEAFRQKFTDEYLGGLRARTKEKYDTVLDVFEEICSPAKLGRVTERTVSAFVTGMQQRKLRQKTGLAPWTRKNYLVALKTALNWAKSQKLIAEVPDFPKVKVPKKKPQPIPTESFEKLLDKAPDHTWRAFLLCGWHCGLRLSEAKELRWEPSEDFPWLDFEGNKIVLPAVFAKSDEDQWVPIHPVLREALEELPRTDGKVFPFRSRKGGGPLNRNAITNRVRFLAQKAGVRLCMHKLRKGFGCRIAKQLGRGDAPVLHRLMRHSTMQISLDYYASVDDALQDKIKELT